MIAHRRLRGSHGGPQSEGYDAMEGEVFDGRT